MVNVHVVKPGERAGFDRVAPRGPRIIGVCNHITDGDPPGDELVWYQRFFGWDDLNNRWGERAWDALTDTVLGRDGRLGLRNDWRDPEWGGRRAGWANGTATGIEGDGAQFVGTLSVGAVNSRLACEESEDPGETMTHAMRDVPAARHASWYDQAKVPSTEHAFTPRVQCVTIL